MRKSVIWFWIILILLFLPPLLSGTGSGFLLPPAAAQDGSDKALEDAKLFIQVKPFSRDGLIAQLEEEGHSHEDAAAAVDTLDTNWNQMALIQASSLLKYMTLSRGGLISQLEAVGFTEEQARYAADNCGADWNEMALEHARSYLRMMNFTKIDLIRQLTHDGFTSEQAGYGVTRILGPLSAEESDALTNPERISDEMIRFLTDNLSLLFPIQSIKENFMTPVIPVYSDLGPETAVQTRTREGVQTIRLYANTDYFTDRIWQITVNAGNLQNFMITMKVHIEDVFPVNQGGCFIGYTNNSTTAEARDEVSLVALLVNPNGVEFYHKTDRLNSGSRRRITGAPKKDYQLTLVRLTGLTVAFVDGEYAGQFYGDEEGPFQLVYGSAVFMDGETSVCSFDDLAVRKVNTQL